ncbi:MAG TPA: nucleotide exchange factor GrpE [Pyrinomonadaceae bacterium]|nr:nucleotide exchange factor GrpE [Pyrinomonadaceae bacterium]
MEFVDYEPEIISTSEVSSAEDDAVERARLEDEIARLERELAEERERHLRTLAEFDNYRRRVRREIFEAGQEGRRELLLSLLEVLDDFERAEEHLEDASDAVAEGLRLIHQRLSNVLESYGVTPFKSAGERFDPEVHEGMSLVDGEGRETGTVYQEYLRGYLWNGRLLRPARVTVVR